MCALACKQELHHQLNGPAARQQRTMLRGLVEPRACRGSQPAGARRGSNRPDARVRARAADVAAPDGDGAAADVVASPAPVTTHHHHHQQQQKQQQQHDQKQRKSRAAAAVTRRAALAASATAAAAALPASALLIAPRPANALTPGSPLLPAPLPPRACAAAQQAVLERGYAGPGPLTALSLPRLEHTCSSW